MLRLAVSTRAETYERMQAPLAERDIEVSHLRTKERTIPLTDPPWESYDVGFVFPSRLMEGGVANAALSIPWVNDREAVLTSRNKAEVLTRLDGVDVPVPETVMISNPTDRDAVIDSFRQFDPPVVVKPNSTTRGVGVARAHDLDSFLGIVDYLNLLHDFRATGDRSFLVQEHLPNARDFRVMLLDGTYAGAVERRIPADALESGHWKHNVHHGAEATGIDLDGALRNLAERVAEPLDIPYLGVDILVTDDRAVVSETNARPTIDEVTKYEEDFWDRLATLIRDTADRDR